MNEVHLLHSHLDTSFYGIMQYLAFGIPRESLFSSGVRALRFPA